LILSDSAAEEKDPGPRLKLGEFLPYRLFVISNRISRELSREYASRYDLTIPQWRVIAVVGENEALYADEICSTTEMDKVTVSRALQVLEKRGRIRRRRDTRDGRRATVRLTAAGRRIYNEIVPQAIEYEQRLLRELNLDESESLSHLLDKLGRGVCA